MTKLKLSTREIGAVSVFDLEGYPTQEALQEIAWKIQKKIRRHRIQRVILNLKNLPFLDPISMRKLLSACLRPQRSLIFGASVDAVQTMEDNYLPKNVRICNSEEAVAEDLGPFLLEKESGKEIPRENPFAPTESIGHQVERRRCKRMHVAIPVEFKILMKNGEPIQTRAIVTNISEGGLFAEYLDLDDAKVVEAIEGIEGLGVEVRLCPCSNFPEEYHLDGVIMRRELRGKQLGLAIKFNEKKD
ncbi:MAG: PilZ domain-containing protein [Candidatus Omnitrophica bacterium]|nr:PilZ domain-containing protein [Candidatus Omnitrophota bacterium]